MAVALVRLLIVLILGQVTMGVSGSCPFHCLCLLDYTPIITNCSGLNLDIFPVSIDFKVQWIDLQDNAIQIVPNLDKYRDLEVLELSMNIISKISTNSFKKLVNLKYLDLSSNLFTDWTQINPRVLLQHLIKLKVLKLSHNSFKTFSWKDVTMRLTSSSLEELHLKSCHIQEVDGKAISGLQKLNFLDLSSNPIKWLDDLSSLTLNVLDISFCDIDSMNPNALINMPSLTTLKLTGNYQFSMNYGNLTSASLQVLEAASCSLGVPGLYGFPNLTYANLRGNKITILKERSFVKNKQLVELDLSSNEIKEIHPQAFIAARQIAFVNLSMNSLKGSLPWNTFSTNYNLKTLDLSMNRLDSVGNLSILGLENLDLSQCQIKEMRKDSLTSLPWLKHLNMSHNPLEKIPDDIQSWYLRNFDLSYCRLSSITNDTFKRFPEIVSINLTGNRFTKPFKIYMFDYNDRLGSLKLSDNPWICNCSSQDFKMFWEFLSDYPLKISQSEQKSIKCMSPDSVSGYPWITACYKTWYPYDESEESASFGLGHYGTALLIMVLTIAGIFGVIGAIKHGIKKKMKQEDEEMNRESRQSPTTQPRVVYQRRMEFDFETPESPELRLSRNTPRERTESQLTQPPTYEEAMLSASREDIVERETTPSRENVAEESGLHRAQDSVSNSDSDSEDRASRQFSFDSDEDDSVDDQGASAKPLNDNK